MRSRDPARRRCGVWLTQCLRAGTFVRGTRRPASLAPPRASQLQGAPWFPPRARHALRTRARAPQAQWRRRAALLIGCGCFPHPPADAPRPLGSRMRMSHLLCTSARADLALPHFPPAVCVLRGRPFWDHGIA